MYSPVRTTSTELWLRFELFYLLALFVWFLWYSHRRQTGSYSVGRTACLPCQEREMPSPQGRGTFRATDVQHAGLCAFER